MTLSGVILLATSRSSKSAEKQDTLNTTSSQLREGNVKKHDIDATLNAQLARQMFDGDASLQSDQYKIWLVKRYSIEKNDVLGGVICSNKLFPTIDAALEHASKLHKWNLDPSDSASNETLEKVERLGITLSDGRYKFKSWKFDTPNEAVDFVEALNKKGL